MPRKLYQDVANGKHNPVTPKKKTVQHSVFGARKTIKKQKQTRKNIMKDLFGDQ